MGSNPCPLFLSMTIRESYLYVQNRLNKLSTNSGDNIEPFKFIEAFRAAHYHWIEDRFKLDGTNTTRIDEIQILLKTIILETKKETNHVIVSLPDDYLHFERATGLPCDIRIWLKSEADINVLLQDDFWKPSYEWQETLGTLQSNTLKVYTDNFNIDQVLLAYYRHPVQVNMSTGYTDINGEPTVDVDSEFDGSSIREILNITCQMLSGDTANQFGYQIHRAQTNQFT